MKLYPFQEIGVKWLAHRKRAYLADEMGLGKTVQAIVAARQIGVRNVLVICPASAIENWKREWARWWPGGPPIYAMSYARLIRTPPSGHENFDLVILDEAHYCKTPSAQRTKAALKVAREAERAWLLSGTPMPNNPVELWPIMKELWPEIPKFFGISTKHAWMDRFCNWMPGDYGPRIYGVKKEETAKLRPRLQLVMKRRLTKDVLPDLPPLRVDVSLLPQDEKFRQALSVEAGKRCDALEDLMQMEQGDDGSISRLRHFLGQYKAPRIGEIICEELAAGAVEQIVVLYHHHKTMDVLYNLFKKAGFTVTGFSGQHSPAARQAAIDLFQEGGADVFLAQQQAAGIAINLQVAHEIVLVEPAWSPEDNSQAVKRIHRIGQDSPCRARIFAVAGTLDEAIMDTLARKTRMITEVLG